MPPLPRAFVALALLVSMASAAGCGDDAVQAGSLGLPCVEGACRVGLSCEDNVCVLSTDGDTADAAPDANDAGADASDGGSDGSADAAIMCRDVSRDIDLLMVVDTSRSMRGEQSRLRTWLRQTLDVLAAGDPNIGRPSEGDPSALFPAATSVHVGVVTTDMGVGSSTAEGLGEGCGDAPQFGDDGRLRDPFGGREPGCEGLGDASFVDVSSDLSDAEREAALFDATCRASAGSDGCGFEQQLEAMLKAVSPSDRSLFTDGTSGHTCPDFASECGASNAGFVRPDSLLVIVVITDENDCSAKLDRTALFDPLAAEYDEDLNTRCFLHGTATDLDEEASALHPISRYVDGIAGLRDDPSDVYVVSVVGIPEELVDEPFDVILRAPSMQERLIANGGGGRGQRIDKACVDPLAEDPSNPLDWAAPGTRFVEMTRGLVERGVPTELGSICSSGYGVGGYMLEWLAAPRCNDP